MADDAVFLGGLFDPLPRLPFRVHTGNNDATGATFVADLNARMTLIAWAATMMLRCS